LLQLSSHCHLAGASHSYFFHVPAAAYALNN
jgi:hypothetical protein